MKGGNWMKRASNSEFEILEILWEAGHELTMEEIMRIHKLKTANQLNENTLCQFLFRMGKKELLFSKRKGKCFYYKPVSKIEYQEFLVNETLLKKVGVCFEEMALAFLGKDITQESVEEIKEKLRNLRDE